ncbi:MAG: TonB-dependent receptor [Bacteroidota bacterium]|nr:TonB-dependent receptor [Bacteroidota bacterium]
MAFLLFSLVGRAQQRVTVTGRVMAGDSAVSGATVQVKGARGAVQTAADGRFSIDAPKGGTLVITHIGFGRQEVKVSSEFTVVTLNQSIQQGSEVVVVGYGTQKRATLTGSVSQVAGSEIAVSPSPNVGASLAGKLPGLIVNQTNGEPGKDDPNILIRGMATIPGPPGSPVNSGPLIIIDGVERSGLTRLDPDDIESISVLKDASAAIYGARAANGVILVTSKSGHKGKTVFDFNYNYGIQNVTKIPKMLDAVTFEQVYNENQYAKEGLLKDPTLPYTPFYTDSIIAVTKAGSDLNNWANTDWVKAVLKSSHVQKIGIQASGGSDAVRYLLSFGSTTQDGDFRHVPDNYGQYNMRLKLDADVAPNLTVGANISGIFSDATYSSVTGQVSVGQPGGTGVNFVNILQSNPTLPAIYPNGDIAPGRLAQSPLLLDQEGYDKVSNSSIYSTFTGTYRAPFLKGLRADISYNYDLANQFEKEWQIPAYYYSWNNNTKNYDHLLQNSVIQDNDIYNKWTTQLTNFRLTYERTIASQHHVTFLVGAEQQYNTNSYTNAGRKNFVSPAIPQLNAGSTAPADQSVSGSASAGAYNNYFGRLNYDFASKYLLEFSFRDNGSQIFPIGKRFGFFPGASAGWVMSEEKFMHDVSAITYLKLRASHGELGNDRVSPYQYLQSYTFGSNYVFGSGDVPGIQPGVVPNADITWEVSKKTDFGVVATLWNGLLGIDATYFIEHRSNILVQPNLSTGQSYGYPGLPDQNTGIVYNHGYELVVTHRQTFKDFSYSLSANFNYARNKVINMDETPSSFAYQNATGHPINAGLYYKYVGIFRDQADLTKNANQAWSGSLQGDQKVANLSGGSKITANDQFRFDYTAIPMETFGLTSIFRYRAFDLDLFFYGQSKVYNYDGVYANLGNTDFSNAMVARATNRWTINNHDGTLPRSGEAAPGATTLYLKDATFIRLKTAEIGYTLPHGVITRTRTFTDVRFYVSGFNVLTWAKAIKYADPEISGNSTTYPQQRIINFGASVKF